MSCTPWVGTLVRVPAVQHIMCCVACRRLVDVAACDWCLCLVTATRALNLGVVGIAVDDKGLIDTDLQCNTAAPGVYAVGDVLGKADLTPAAIQAGIAALPSRHHPALTFQQIVCSPR